MTRAEAAAEYGALLRLLREHAFLRYSSAGAAEWEDKLRSVSALFAALVSGAAGLALPDPYPHSGLEKAQRSDFGALAAQAKRCAALLAAAAGRAEGRERVRLAAAAAAWKRAALALASPGG